MTVEYVERTLGLDTMEKQKLNLLGPQVLETSIQIDKVLRMDILRGGFSLVNVMYSTYVHNNVYCTVKLTARKIGCNVVTVCEKYTEINHK